MSPSHFVTRSAGFFMAFSIPKRCPIREVTATKNLRMEAAIVTVIALVVLKSNLRVIGSVHAENTDAVCNQRTPEGTKAT
jgi:hypothetical protein